MSKKLLVNLVSKVNASGIRRETRGGLEYIIVPSRTLPANTVMNGGLYPKAERDNTFIKLNGTHAPIGHPKDHDGNYISANSGEAVALDYSIGAVNENARLNAKLDLIELDKAIPVKKAMETAKGRDLLNRVNLLEKGKGEPIHTSTGLFLEVEKLDAPQVNEAGDEYSWVGSNFTWDHDAILLNEVGANQPHQSVGMFTNSDGDQLEAFTVNLDINYDDQNTPESGEKEGLLAKIATLVNSAFANNKKQHYNENDLNNNSGNETMREKNIAALTEMGISVNADITDGDLQAIHDKMTANDKSEGDSEKLTAIMNSVADLQTEVKTLKTNAEAGAIAAKAALVDKVVATKVLGLNKEQAEAMPELALQTMLNTVKPDFSTAGVDASFEVNGDDAEWKLGADE